MGKPATLLEAIKAYADKRFDLEGRRRKRPPRKPLSEQETKRQGRGVRTSLLASDHADSG